MQCRRADLLVVAVGSPELVKADWVKPGAVVLDVGINVEEDDNGKSHILGDVAFEEVSQIAGQPLANLGLGQPSSARAEGIANGAHLGCFLKTDSLPVMKHVSV